MNLPQIGELNRRVKIFFTVHLPDDRLGFSKATAHEDEVWGKIEPVGSIIYWGAKQVDSGVTHRITVRRIKGRTRPQDFAGVVELEVWRQSGALPKLSGRNGCGAIRSP